MFRLEKKAFTLIELLVVVLIIGILASFAVPYYRRVVEFTRIAEPLNLFGNLDRGIQLDLLQNGQNALFDPRTENLKVFNRMIVGLDNLYQGEKFFCSKHFMYGADCNKWNNYTCRFTAYRMPDDRRKKGRCQTISMDRSLYVVAMDVSMSKPTTRCLGYWKNTDHSFADDIGLQLIEDGKVDGMCVKPIDH